MAITARTILTQPAATAVAAVTLLGLTALGTGAFETLQTERANVLDPCERPIVEQNEATWSEADWISYVSCYESRRDVPGTVRAATLALSYQPDSEILWNARSIGEIMMGDYATAQSTLKAALKHVEPTTGTMENNLAWAGMWTEMDAHEQRDLYTAALEKTPLSCEIIHTGLFVEYRHAKSDDRYQRFWALKKYKQLRLRYANQRCDERIRYGNWTTLAEVGGLGMLDEEVEKLSGRADLSANRTLRSAVKVLRDHHLGASIDDYCAEALPPSHGDVDCVDHFEETRAQLIAGPKVQPKRQVVKSPGCDFGK